ncbi:MAG: hypothetical protein J6Z41_01020 [Prevotella sp.]|nr:hypothetical protein [Prevotella sp.]
MTNGKLDVGSNTVTIDLNGHKLSRSLSANENYGMVIYVNGGNLTINGGRLVSVTERPDRLYTEKDLRGVSNGIYYQQIIYQNGQSSIVKMVK